MENMESLLKKIRGVEEKNIMNLINQRWEEFKKLGKKGNNEWFKELCFCILTANSPAKAGIKTQKIVGDGFLTLNLEELYKKLKTTGQRFPRKKAEYIINARQYSQSIKDRVKSFGNGKKAREWLANNILGIGMKEASHFLRNVGYDDVAIIDRHIVNLLVEHNMVSRPNTITKRKYIDVEKVVEILAKETGIPLGKLDLIMWYIKTGKVMK